MWLVVATVGGVDGVFNTEGIDVAVVVMVTLRGDFGFLVDIVHNTKGFCFCVTNSRQFAE